MPDKWQSQMLLTVAVFDICPTLRISPSWMMMWGAFVCSEAPRWRDGHPGARRAGVLWEWAAWVHACSEVWGLSVLGSLGLVWSHFSGGFAPSLASTWLQSPVGQPTPSAAFCSPLPASWDFWVSGCLSAKGNSGELVQPGLRTARTVRGAEKPAAPSCLGLQPGSQDSSSLASLP